MSKYDFINNTCMLVLVSFRQEERGPSLEAFEPMLLAYWNRNLPERAVSRFRSVGRSVLNYPMVFNSTLARFCGV